MNALNSALGTHEIALEAFGVRVGVSVSRAADIDRVLAILPPGWQPCPRLRIDKRLGIRLDESGDTYRLIRDGKPFTKGLDLDLALALLESQIRGYVALHASDMIFVHAGAVEYQGRAILLPGMSFAGKTTLVAALVRAGATYYSDEFAPLDGKGLVHPYARPLTIRDSEQRGVPHDIASLGGIAGQEPLRIGAVVVTAYRPGAVWTPRRLTRGEGVLALLANTVPARERPAEALRFIRNALDGSVLIQSDRDEAEALVPRLLADLPSNDLHRGP